MPLSETTSLPNKGRGKVYIHHTIPIRPYPTCETTLGMLLYCFYPKLIGFSLDDSSQLDQFLTGIQPTLNLLLYPNSSPTILAKFHYINNNNNTTSLILCLSPNMKSAIRILTASHKFNSCQNNKFTNIQSKQNKTKLYFSTTILPPPQMWDTWTRNYNYYYYY